MLTISEEQLFLIRQGIDRLNNEVETISGLLTLIAIEIAILFFIMIVGGSR